MVPMHGHKKKLRFVLTIPRWAVGLSGTTSALPRQRSTMALPWARVWLSLGRTDFLVRRNHGLRDSLAAPCQHGGQE